MFYEATSKFWKLELISTQQGKLRGRYVLNHYVLEQNTKPKVFFNSISCATVRLKRALGLLNRPASFPNLLVYFGTEQVLSTSAHYQKLI